MMTTLTDRYVHAATRWLPGRLRHEVTAELRERIDDTVAARGDDPRAEREVLEDLGDPLRVAVQYTDREPVLIGPRWFFVWLRLLILLVAIVPTVVAVIEVFVAVGEGAGAAEIIGRPIWTWLSIAGQVALWTTAVFAVLEWTGTDPDVDDAWTIDRLPTPAPKPSVADTVATVAFVTLAAALLVWQHTGSPFVSDGERLPVLDPSLWAWWIPTVLAILAVEVGHAIWVAVRGWSPATALANAAVAIAFAVVTIPALLGASFVNPDLIAHLGWEAETVETSLRWIAAGVAAVTVWDVVEGFVRTWRASQ